MNLEQINQRISQVNEESKRLNNERQISIGRKETLTQQLNEALESYSKKYGVSITPDTLEAEVNRVMQLKQAELENVERVLNLIKEGKYEEVGGIVNPVQAEQVVPQQTTSHIESNPEPVSQSVLPPIFNTGVSEQVPNLGVPSQEVHQQVSKPSSSMNLSGLSDDISDSRPIAPPPTFNKPTQQLSGLDMPASTPSSNVTSDVTSFSAIIGGTAFAPDGN